MEAEIKENAKSKKVFHQEWVFAIAMILMSFSVMLATKSSFGVSMVVAPAYTIHFKLMNGLNLQFFTFGRVEYMFQFAMILLLAASTLRFRWKWLLSFITAFLYGTMIDFFSFTFDLVFKVFYGASYDSFIESRPVFNFFGYMQPYSVLQVILLVCGLILTSLAVALFFKTYMPLQVYELFVREFADRWGFKISRVKPIYDYTSLAVALALVFILFGRFNSECVGIGTVAAVIVNSPLINFFSKVLDKKYDFQVYPKIRKWLD